MTDLALGHGVKEEERKCLVKMLDTMQMTCQNTIMLKYFVCTLLLRTSQVLIALQKKIAKIKRDLWEWLLVGVVVTNKLITDVKPERAVPVAFP